MGTEVSSADGVETLIADAKALDRSCSSIVIAPESSRKNHSKLKTALARAWRWRGLMESGSSDSILVLAKRERVGEAYIKKVLSLAFLPPTVIQEILAGTRYVKVGDSRLDERGISWTAR
jgi:hypothetical protein